MKSPTVTISGCHSGPNPSPGLGIARSLRAAFPGARLVAKDHSPQSSGLHGAIFDDTWLLRPWNELDLDLHLSEIHQTVLPDSSFYISGFDLESRWLGSNCNDRVLSPSASAVDATSKPHYQAARGLPVSVPAACSMELSSLELYRFCLRHGWRAWAKGPAYEALPVRSWADVEQSRVLLENTWGEQPFFLQQHVEGWEVSVAYAAFKGELLEAVLMEKRQITPEGKTWAGSVQACPPAFRERLEDVLSELKWTGGGEIELVRDGSEHLWLIDWNPRFPAWIHGATLAGFNLPAALVARAAGMPNPASKSPPESSMFVRVIEEIPIRPDIGLPPPPLSVRSLAMEPGKHPSGMPMLMRRKNVWPARHEPATGNDPARAPACVVDAVFDAESRVTPHRIFLPELAAKRLSATFRAAQQCGPEVLPALSIKTNPDKRLVSLARQHGFMAEVISSEESQWAEQNGFSTTQLIFNGPFPVCPGREPYAACFADSIDAFELCADSGAAGVSGVRIRAFGSHSRFGVALDDAHEFERLVKLIRRLSASARIGFSIHLQSSVTGRSRWITAVQSAIDFAAAVRGVTGCNVSAFDCGGGWSHLDFDHFLAEDLERIVRQVRLKLPTVERFYFEPGKAISDPSGVLVSRCIALRRKRRSRDVVIDASIAELPLANFHPYEIFAFSREQRVSVLLPYGRDRVLGRICMENDVLARQVQLPDWLREGDLLVFTNVGGYDTSMAYEFGKGRQHGHLED